MITTKKNRWVWWWVLCLLFNPVSVWAETVPTELNALLKKNKVAQKNVGLVVVRLDTHQTIAAINPDKAFNPASVIKVATAAAAIDKHHANYTWQTLIGTDGQIKNGTLTGNLYLVGGGDPYITVEQFDKMVKSLRQSGIQKIDGNLIIDDSYYQLPPHNPATFDGAEFRTYNVGAYAMLVNFKALEVVVHHDGEKISTYTIPNNDNFVLENKIKANKKRCRNWRSKIREQYDTKDATTTLKLGGSYSVYCKKQSFQLAALTPLDYVGGFFSAAWREMGGEFSGNYRAGRAPDNMRVLAKFNSLPLSQILQLMNKYSNNVIARHLFLSLADDAPARDLLHARSAMQEWLAQQGITDAFIDNGSGLSRQTRISPAALATILQNIWAHPYRPEIIASLPIWGVDGTLKQRPTKKITKGLARLKTGNLNNVKAVGGIVRSANNTPYAVVIFTQKTSRKRVERLQYGIVQWLDTLK